MSGLQEEYLQHQTKIEQLRLSIQYIRWYLVSLILLCLISAIIFFLLLYFLHYKLYLVNWLYYFNAYLSIICPKAINTLS